MRRRLAESDPGPFSEVEAALARDPNNVEALVLHGELMLAARAPAAAAPVLTRAVELNPAFAEAQDALGQALHALGRNDEAIRCFERAIGIAHDFVPAHISMGRLYESLGQTEEAADCFNLALAFDANAIEAQLGIGRLLRTVGRLDDSLVHFRESTQGAPGYGPAFFELARTLNESGDVEGAIGAYEQAIALRPDYAEALVNLGLMHLSQLGDAHRAEILFRQAAQAVPGLIEAQANLGLALQEQGRFDDAERHYEAQILRWPDIAEFRWNRGIASLAAGKFNRAWDDFELRKHRPDARGIHEKFHLPVWDGSPLEGKSILIYGEQGVGDEIMFASCLPEVAMRADLCVVECDARLAALYRRSFPGACIEPRGADRTRDWHATYPALNLQSAVGSLPRFLRRRTQDFPDHQGYLVADAEASAKWRAEFDQSRSLRKVGISWRGGTRKTRGGLRSIDLDRLEPLVDRAGVVFVVLQRDLSAAERAALARWPAVLIPELPSDMDGLAALHCALDLIISVDNTNVHLAGALGLPVWVLLAHSPEWRYQWNGERMCWYPSARLLRQPRPGDWQTVIAAAGDRLAQFLA